MQVHLTLKSANVKTGPIPVSTTERDSCPADCQMKAECYAASGPLALHWSAVSDKKRGTEWPEFTKSIAALPAANAGKRGFTYSHHRDAASIDWIRHANAWGFTVNLSANDLNDADYLADQNAGPVVVVLPSTQNENLKTPAGRPVVVCPATQRDDVSCATCQLCQRQRAAIVGFPAHGSRHRVINLRLAA